MMEKSRLFDHKSMVEQERHTNVTKELRFFPMLPSKVEDELHFISEYQCYSQFRKPSWHYSNLIKFNRFKTIVTSKC